MDENSRLILLAWVGKAEEDYEVATRLAAGEEPVPIGGICLHAQQCVEKYLKAMLIKAGVDFPKTHDIGIIQSLLPADLRVDIAVEDQRRLTAYATSRRYPGLYAPLTLSEAGSALEIARIVRESARAHLEIQE